ncbi:MAG: hypothetical protein AAFP20_04175 [Cyanobacteria bacterium J06614_10]
MQVTFDQLWAIAQQVANQSGQSTQNAFLSLALILERPVAAWQYYCTPKNVITFASTGCDGVHFSFLQQDRMVSGSAPISPIQQLSRSPVVMTVPMNFENQNIVVSENLYEFLCLGCRTSYGMLELLSCPESNLCALKSFDYAEALSEAQVAQLRLLNDAFSLSPYINLEGRMRHLQSTYLSCLQMGEVAVGDTTHWLPSRPISV